MKFDKSMTISKSSSVDAKSYFFSTFKKMAIIADEAVRFGTLGDDNAIRSRIDELRQVWSSLPEDYQAISDSFHSDDDPVLIEMHEKFKRNLNFIYAWCKRFEPVIDNEEFRNSDDGLEYLIDSRLPPIWNWENDLIVLFSRKKHKLARLLAARGHRRCLVITGRVNKDMLEEIKRVCSAYGLVVPKRVHIIEAPVSEKQARGVERVVKALCDACVRSLMTNNTNRTFNRLNTLQRIKNSLYLTHASDIDMLRENFSGMPVLIVSPGPSLAKNIEVLKTYQDNAVIVAVAQSVPALIKHNIHPDFIVVLDPQDFSGIVDGLDFNRTNAIFIDCVNELFLKKPFKNIFINYNFRSPNDFTEAVGAVRANIDGGSVSVFAFNLAIYLNSQSITLIGQDLSFGDSLYYVGDGWNSFDTPPEDLIKNSDVKWNKIKTWTLKGYYGGTVQTRGDYWAYHSQFVEIAQQLKTSGRNVRIYNCTEGGSYIDGFEHIPLQVFFEKSANIEIEKSMRDFMVSESNIEMRILKVKRYLKNVKNKCIFTLGLIKEGEKIFQGKRSIKYLKLNSENMQKAILENEELSSMAYNYLADVSSRLQRDKKMQDDNTISADIYGILKNDCKVLIGLVDEALFSFNPQSKIKSTK
jgi:hypothetical protein